MNSNNFPYKLLIILATLFPFAQEQETVFLSDRDSYLLNTTALQSNPQKLKFSKTEFIWKSNDLVDFTIANEYAELVSFKVVPLFTTNFRFFFAFNAQEIFILRYNIIQKQFFIFDPIRIIDILKPSESLCKLVMLGFLSDGLCFLELKDFSKQRRLMVSLKYTFDEELGTLGFAPNPIWYYVVEKYADLGNCVPKFKISSKQDCFLRFCPGDTSYDVFLVHLLIFKYVMYPKYLNLVQMRSVYLTATPLYLEIYYLSFDNLWKYDMNERGNERNQLVKETVLSFYTLGSDFFYFIDPEFDLYLVINGKIEFIYTLPFECEDFHWFNFNDIFFICKKPDPEGSTDMYLYLASSFKVQKFHLKNKLLIRSILLPTLGRMAFVAFSMKSNNYDIVIVSLSRIMTQVFFKKTDRHLECPHFMNHCRLFQVTTREGLDYNFLVFDSSRVEDPSVFWQYLYNTQELDTVEWNMTTDKNRIRLTDYFSGFLSKISIWDDLGRGDIISKLKSKNVLIEIVEHFDLKKYFKSENYKDKEGIFTWKTNIVSYHLEIKKSGKVLCNK